MGEQLSWLKTKDPVELGRSKKTIKRYGGAVRSFQNYCNDRQVDPACADPHTLARWVASRFQQHPSATQITVSLAAARMIQKALPGGLEAVPYTRSAMPQLDALVNTLMRSENIADKKRARPLVAEDVRNLVRAARQITVQKGRGGESARKTAARDAALFLLGWWGGLRADELSRVEWTNLERVPKGYELRMRGAKNTRIQIALAEKPNHEFCPVHAIEEYREVLFGSAHPAGRVFPISPNMVSKRVQVVAKRASLGKGFTGHSMRAGFATEASRQNVPDRLVMDHARWVSGSVHGSYVRDDIWQKTPTLRMEL
jgi:integrase